MTKKEFKEKLEKRVGFLRQWLNEDRITESEKLVTDEMIIYWLTIDFSED